MTGNTARDVLLAFDFGFRRIGIATANLRTRTASPLVTLRVGKEFPWQALDQTIDEWHPGQLVVGLPDPETARDVAERIQVFIGELQTRYNLPVSAVDESYTSRAAHSDLTEARRSGRLTARVRKEQIDSHAACLIAEQWMSE